jgi:hypothetical protein
MATFALGAAGQARFGPIGGFIGGVAGSLIDRMLFAPDPIVQEGPRLSDLARQADSPGAPIARLWGAQNRTAGTVIWTSGLKETRHEEEMQGGKGTPEPAAVIVTYTYSVDLAVLVCRGPVVAVPRIWGGPKLVRDSGGDRGVSDIRIALGTASQQPDALLEAAEGAGNVPAFRPYCVVYFQDLQLADFGNAVPPLSFEVDAGPATVQSVAAGLFALAGLTASEYAVTNVSLEPVPGFALRRLASPREGLERLGAAFGFDVSDTGYMLKLRRRERSPDLVLDEDDFGAAPPGGIEARQPESHVRDSERQLPRQIVLTHGDPDRDLQISAQRSERLISESERDMIIEFPGTLTASRARDALDDLIGDLWSNRYSFSVELPPKYLQLDAGDIVTIRRSDETFWPSFLVTRASIGADWRIAIEARPIARRWAMPSAPATSGSIVTQVVPLPNDSLLELMDLPLLTNAEADSNGLYAAVGDSGAGGNEWTGAVLYRSPDDAEYTAVARFDIGAAIGTADEALGTGPFYWPDRANTVRVTLSSGALASITEEQWLHTSRNAALLGDELITYRDATLIAGTTWELSGLKRGRRGTEWARGSHAIGERFVLLTRSTVKRVFLDLGLLNNSLYYKAVTFDQALADVAAEQFAIGGEWAAPYAGLDAEGARDGSDNLTIAWRRRGRQGGGTWVGEVPLGEETEAYEIDIMDGVVKRTLTATSESVLYTAADQTTDFGSPQSAVEVNIYQISGLVARGHALNATV